MRRTKCKLCGRELKYSNRYDARYCEPCDVWFEKKCKDDNCNFCTDRPEKPSMVIISE